MATYEAKDEQTGKTVTFDWNDPAPPSEKDLVEVFAAAKQTPSDPETQPDMPWYQNLAVGMGKGFTDIGTGAMQRAGEVAGALGMDTKDFVSKLSKQTEENRTAFAPLADKSIAAKIGEFAGQTLPTATLPGGVAGGLLKRAATSALAGGAVGALQPTTGDENVSGNALIGGIAGAGGSAALSALGKGYNLINGKLPDNFVNALSKKYGIRTTLGEETGNPLIQRTETWLERIPLIGLKSFREKQHAESEIAARELLGKYIYDPQATDIMSANRGYSGKLFDDLKTTVAGVQNQIIKPVETKAVASDLLTNYPDLFKKFQNSKRESLIKDIVHGTEDAKDPYAVLSSLYGMPSAPTPKTLNFEEAWSLRKGLGDMIGQARQKVVSGDVDKTTLGELSKLYGAINNDIDRWISSVGRPDVAQAISAANESYKKYVVKYDIIQRAFDKAAGVSSSKELFSPKTFSTDLKKMIYENREFNRFTPVEVDEISGLANILQVVKRAGQYVENPPTGDRWGVPILGIGVGSMSVPAVSGAALVTGITRFVTGTEAGKRLALTASKIEPTNPNMKIILKMVYNQVPKWAATSATKK